MDLDKFHQHTLAINPLQLGTEDYVENMFLCYEKWLAWMKSKLYLNS